MDQPRGVRVIQIGEATEGRERNAPSAPRRPTHDGTQAGPERITLPERGHHRTIMDQTDGILLVQVEEPTENG